MFLSRSHHCPCALLFLKEHKQLGLRPVSSSLSFFFHIFYMTQADTADVPQIIVVARFVTDQKENKKLLLTF